MCIISNVAITIGRVRIPSFSVMSEQRLGVEYSLLRFHLCIPATRSKTHICGCAQGLRKVLLWSSRYPSDLGTYRWTFQLVEVPWALICDFLYLQISEWILEFKEKDVEANLGTNVISDWVSSAVCLLLSFREKRLLIPPHIDDRPRWDAIMPMWWYLMMSRFWSRENWWWYDWTWARVLLQLSYNWWISRRSFLFLFSITMTAYFFTFSPIETIILHLIYPALWSYLEWMDGEVLKSAMFADGRWLDFAESLHSWLRWTRSCDIGPACYSAHLRKRMKKGLGYAILSPW